MTRDGRTWRIAHTSPGQTIQAMMIFSREEAQQAVAGRRLNVPPTAGLGDLARRRFGIGASNL